MTRLSSVLLLFFLLDLLIEPIAGKIPAVIVFGDSLVDAGNNNYLRTPLKANFKPYGRDFFGGKPTGRFSNGRVATDFISEGLGLKKTIPAYLDPHYNIDDFATGVCFASAGTGLDVGTSHILNVMPLDHEVENFKKYIARLKERMGDEKTAELLKEAVYIVSLGTNDFLENYYAPLRTASTYVPIEQYEDLLLRKAEKFFVEIYRLGARKVAMCGISPMGCLPLVRSTVGLGKCFEMFNRVARIFNCKLEAMFTKLNQALPGLKIVLHPLYDMVQDMVHHPSKYGFDNVDKGCCGTGMFEMSFLCNQINPFTCNNPDKYLFWDSFHPGQKAAEFAAHIAVNTTLAQFR